MTRTDDRPYTDNHSDYYGDEPTDKAKVAVWTVLVLGCLAVWGFVAYLIITLI